MKNLLKFLRASKKMEVRQVARKAKEIDEVYAFNLQREVAGCHQFDQMLEDDGVRREIRKQKSEPISEMEEDFVARHNDVLTTVEAFERDALETQQYAEGNAFDIIAEMQGFDFEETRPHAVKQLPAAPSDVFANTLTDVTESQLEEESTHNKQAITPWQEKVRTALTPQEKSPSKKQSRQDEPDEPTSELSEEHIQEALSREEEFKKAKPTDSVFYFRPSK
jgi:hypothetical protein